MARFYLHLHIGSDLIVDDQGVDLDSLAAARTIALRVAREAVADLLSEGQSLEGVRIEICDDAGKSLLLIQCDDGAL